MCVLLFLNMHFCSKPLQTDKISLVHSDIKREQVFLLSNCWSLVQHWLFLSHSGKSWKPEKYWLQNYQKGKMKGDIIFKELLFTCEANFRNALKKLSFLFNFHFRLLYEKTIRNFKGSISLEIYTMTCICHSHHVGIFYKESQESCSSSS